MQVDVTKSTGTVRLPVRQVMPSIEVFQVARTEKQTAKETISLGAFVRHHSFKRFCYGVPECARCLHEVSLSHHVGPQCSNEQMAFATRSWLTEQRFKAHKQATLRAASYLLSHRSAVAMQNQWHCPFLISLTLRTGWWRRAGCWPTSDQNFGTKLGSSRIHLFQAWVFHSLIHVTSGGKSGIGKCLTVDPPVLLPTFTGILCSERVNIGAGSFRSRSLLMFEMCWPEVPICDNRIHELILPYPAFCRSLLAACVMRWISTPEISPQTHAESNSSTRSDLMLSAAKKLSSKFAAFLAVVRRMELQNDSLPKDVLSISNAPNSNKMCVQ